MISVVAISFARRHAVNNAFTEMVLVTVARCILGIINYIYAVQSRLYKRFHDLAKSQLTSPNAFTYITHPRGNGRSLLKKVLLTSEETSVR